MTDVRPMGDYATVRVAAGFFVTAGVTPRVDGMLRVRGTVGVDLDDKAVARAVLLAAQNLVRIVDTAKITAVKPLGLTVYIACDPAFTEHTRVADLCMEPLGERFSSLPARAAIGVNSLPGGSPIELSLTGACDPE